MTTPRISVLIPTRGGAALLGGCLDAVLADPGSDLEVVVSDNANTDGTTELLARYADDPRLRVIRQPEVLGVTDNWTATLEASTGEYLLMLGDDDLVLPGFFPVVRRALADNPDCLSYEAWMFAAPGTIAGVEGGRYGTPWDGTRELARSGRFDYPTRRRMLGELFAFRHPIALTMPTTIVSRRMVDRLGGDLFKAPFPDWYAYAALLVQAVSWKYLPHRLAVIGVSAGSFGHYFNTTDYRAGFEYLGWKPAATDGEAEMLDAVVEWLAVVHRDFAQELGGIDIDRSEYAVRRVWGWVKRRRRGELETRELLERVARMPVRDQAALVVGALRPRNVRQAVRVRRSARSYAEHPWWRGFRPVDAADIHAFATHLVASGQLDPILLRAEPSVSVRQSAR